MAPPDDVLAQMWKQCQFTDLEVRCGDYRQKVHKAVVCLGSDYFAKACQSGKFVEGESGVVDLPVKQDDGGADDDGHDPALIRRLLHSFYHTNGYQNCLLAEDSNIRRLHRGDDQSFLVLHAKMYLTSDYFSAQRVKKHALMLFKESLSATYPQISTVVPELLKEVLRPSTPVNEPLRKLLFRYLARNLHEIAENSELYNVLEHDQQAAHEVLMQVLQIPRGGW